MKLADYNRISQEVAGARPIYLGAVLSVHGMNTYGAWQKNITTTLQDACLRYIPVDYGYRRLRVLRPFTRGMLDEASQRIVAAYEDHIRARLRSGAIGHSFGTLAIGHALRRNPDLVLPRIVLFGAILPRSYSWAEVIERGQVQKVLNETCSRDFWPRLAPYSISGAGNSGCRGFDPPHPDVHERHYGWTEHSELATPLHCANVWVPFLLGQDPR